MRREILRLLARRAQTAKELSETIGLTPPSIGHHLKALLQGQLVSVIRNAPESHGIMQKWYQSTAQAFIVDMEQLPRDIRRYFMPIYIERARMISACVSIFKNNIIPSTGHIENLTHEVCRALCKTAQKLDDQLESDPEKVVNRLYVEALRPMIS